MGGKHHHHHHGGRRFGRGRGFGVDVVDYVPEYVDNECWIERFPDGTFRKRCPPVEALGFSDAGGPIGYLRYSEGAGDILPTLVTADTAKAYLQETNTQYETLDQAIQHAQWPGQPPGDFIIAWTGTLVGWKAFFNTAMATVGFFTAKSVMDQTDRWVSTLAQFSSQFHMLAPSSPVPTAPAPPGQGTGGPTDLGALLKGSTGLIVAGAALAAILVFGPRLSKG
jgi:hypothetical protein